MEASETTASAPAAHEDQRALCRTFWEAALGSAPPEVAPARTEVTRRRIDRARSVARMRREARALARLDHPNVVTVHEVDVIGRARVLLAAGRLNAAEQLLDGSNALDLTSDAVASSVEELRAGIDAARGEHEDAERHASRALGLAERVGDREAALRAWLRLHTAAVAQGHHERARLYATRAASLARRGAPASLEDAAQQAAAATPTASLGS